jgi:dipeptidyl-peptidase-4
MLHRLFTFLLVSIVSAVPLSAAAADELQISEIFTAVPPWGALPSKFLWSPDGRSFLYELSSQDPAQAPAVRQYDVQSGGSRVLVDPARYPGKPETPDNVAWSPDGTQLAFSVHGRLYVRDIATNFEREIAPNVSDVQWSPKGSALAYTRNADLYVAGLKPNLRIIRLTSDGVPNAILNGDVDWLYHEEFDTQHGFAWSPDGNSIAYVRMDERAVTSFPIVNFLRTDNTVAYQRYPLAGERNPHVSLHIVDVQHRSDRLVYDGAARDEYLPAIGWKPASHALIAEVLDRAQKNARVVAWDGTRSELYEQRDDKWVDALQLPYWLRGGASLWVLERDNVAGLYLRDARGRFKRLTAKYRVDSVLFVNEKQRVAYVTAAYPTRRDRAVLAVPLDGGAPANVTPAPGSHSVAMAPTGALFIDTHSTLNDPPAVDLIEMPSGSVRATLAAENASLKSRLLPVRMLSVPSKYGALDAYEIRPAGFTPARKYPVIIYVYGGPEAPTTANAFGNARGLYHNVLAQHGFIVFSIDGPASQIDDESNVRMLYHNLGPASLLGQKIGVEYLRSLPYVDAARIGIWGWSFGGYETLYALTHSDLFKAGAAGAPVTDWRLYDSAYTERYMGTPSSDPAAYNASSVLQAAQPPAGDVLVSHGTADDNVHMANSVSLLQRFVTADRAHIDFMAYPGQRHGFTALPDLRHLYERMLNWWMTHL